MDQNDSKFPVERGDTNRSAQVVITGEGHSAEEPITIDAKKYHGLISGLRIAITTLNNRIRDEKFPTLNKDRVDAWKAQRDELIEALVSLDI